MKTFVIAAMSALALTATSAAAADFSGPRAEVTLGGDGVVNLRRDPVNLAYGANIGFDQQFGRVVVGVEAGADNVMDRRDLNVGVRAGVAVNPHVLTYVKAGYTNWKPAANLELEGVRLGAGVEAHIVGPFYGKVEYRYSDLTRNAGRHGGLVGLGIRF